MKLPPEAAHEIGAKAAIASALLAKVRPFVPEGPIFAAEVGVKRGQLAVRLLKAEPRLYLWRVDRWAPAGPAAAYRTSGDPAANASQQECEAWLAEALDRTQRFRKRRNLLVLDSLVAARSVMDGFMDLVFLNADHSYAARQADLEAWTRKVKPGGLVAGGLWTSRFGGDCCARAVAEFLKRRAWTEKVQVHMGPEHTWWFTRPNN